jgi:hypothetical protein
MMESGHAVSADEDALTLADIYPDIGKNPDPTGDYAAGRFEFYASSEEFLASLDEAISQEAG